MISVLGENDIEKSFAPSWIRGAVMYQIFPDRFCNGNPANDVRDNEYIYGAEYDEGAVPVLKKNWREPVKDPDFASFYGGDLEGILAKLPHLKSLHVEAIYLNPVFVSLSSHRYDIMDYEHIDPHLTTGDINTSNEYFASFVETCHKAGIRVIIDGVFNHCSSSHPFFKEALSNAGSPKRNWFSFKEDGEPEYWWGVKTLPKFNYEHARDLEDYILGIAAKWVSPPYNCDGWRLDVAEDLGHSPEYNHLFWKKFRKAVKNANPEAVIIAETYSDPSPWLKGDEWDGVMNYRGFMDPVSFYVTGTDKHSDYVREDLRADVEAFTDAYIKGTAELSSAVLCSMNQLDNHDHSRMITRTAKTAGRLKELGSEKASQGIDPGLLRIAAVMQFTLPGIPCIYYGDETALPGFTDPDSRRPYPWGEEDVRMIDFYANLSFLHKSAALREGSLLIPENAGKDILIYIREKGNESFLIAVNLKDESMLVTLKLPGIKEAARQLLVTGDIFSAGKKIPRPVSEEGFIFTSPAKSAKVYRLTKD